MAAAAHSACARCGTRHCRHAPRQQDNGAAALLILIALAVLGIGAVAEAIAPPSKPAPTPATWSATARSDIPGSYQQLYAQAAATCSHLTPQLLAGIGKVETNHGRSDLPGVTSGLNRYRDDGQWKSCCAGPMQFNLTNGPPSTWDAYKAPGDTRADVYRPDRAIPAAARLLCANGVADNRIRDAVWNYNHSDAYIDDVLAWAARYRGEAA